MNNKQTPIARRTGIVVRKIKDEVLIYDTDQHQAHCLNEHAALIWEYCDGRRTIQDLCDLLNTPEEISESQREQFIWIALDELRRADLLEEPFVQPNLSTGISRRQLMKTAGIATLMALPIVSTIISPTAAQASTCLASGQGCTISPQCCSGLCSSGVCV